MNRAAFYEVIFNVYPLHAAGYGIRLLFKKFGEGERLFYLRSPVYGPLAQLV